MFSNWKALRLDHRVLNHNKDNLSYFVLIFSYLYVSCSRSITSVGEERAYVSAIVYLELCSFCSESFPLPLGAWDGLRYFIVVLPEPSI